MEGIYNLSQKYGFKIIEDASHAIGAQYKGEPIGNCKYSDITTFSFHPVKIITTGEGGMVLTNDRKLFNKMYRLRSHGIVRDSNEMTHAPDGQWYYQQLELGFNYRMTDIQAALGYSQMKRLDDFVVERHEIAERYNHILAKKSIRCPHQHPDSYSAYHLYIIRLKLDEVKYSHTQIFEHFRSNGVLVNLHYIPIYRQPYYEKMGFNIGDYPESEAYYNEAISLPIYPGLTQEMQNEIINLFEKPIGHQTLF